MIISDDDILKRAREVWHDAFAGFTIFDLLHAQGSPLDALLFAKLFWPDFHVLSGMTFLSFAVEDRDDERRILERLESIRDAARVEEEFNRVEVASLFGRRRGETLAEGDAVLAQYLAATWAAKLRNDFPVRRFRVRVIDPDGALEVAVTLYEER